MVWSTDVVMKNESRGEKSGSFILWTLEVLSAFIRLFLQHLISSARHCWQRLLCHPQHFPQLPGLFEAEERDIYNRVRSEVKTRGLNFSTTLGDYLRFRLEFYGLILLMLYRQFFIPAFHTEVGRQGGGWPRFLASVFLDDTLCGATFISEIKYPRFLFFYWKWKAVIIPFLLPFVLLHWFTAVWGHCPDSTLIFKGVSNFR